MSASASCSHCGKQGGAALRRCARCKQASYCGADCQKEAWKTHKGACAAPPPPGDVEGDLSRLLVSGSGSRRSPLHAAAGDGSEGEVRKLLDAGADVASSDGNEGTALHSASRGGHAVVVRMLLDAGADVVATDRF
ncbi:hypothetical protein T484DRAFT_1646020, partial [Baffinella frigidus]